jgi:ubiquitin carboxyl-terminal hydrolase 2/21
MKALHPSPQLPTTEKGSGSIGAGSSMGSCTSRTDAGTKASFTDRGVSSTVAHTEKPHKQNDDWSNLEGAAHSKRSFRRSESLDSITWSLETGKVIDSKKTPPTRRHSFKSAEKSDSDVQSLLNERNKKSNRNDSSAMREILFPDASSKLTVTRKEQSTKRPSSGNLRKFSSEESLVAVKDHSQFYENRQPSTPTPQRKHLNRQTDVSSNTLSSSNQISSVEDINSQAERITFSDSVNKTLHNSSVQHTTRTSPQISSSKQSTNYPTYGAQYRGNSPSSHSSGISLQSNSPTGAILKSSYGSPSLVRSSRYPGLIGLRNLGNTCFMNSVLQCLSHTQPLTSYFCKEFEKEARNKDNSKKGRLARSYAALLKEMWHAPGQDCDFALSDFKKQIQKFAPRFVGYSQQDSQEFLRFLLDGLHEDLNRATRKPEFEPPHMYRDSVQQLSKWWWKNYKKYADSKITELFVGQLKSTVTCKECGEPPTESHKFDPFWDLSLPIPQTSPYNSLYGSSLYSSRDNLPSLEDCFELFTQKETLKGSDKPYCNTCKRKTESTKEIKLDRLPPILVIRILLFQDSLISDFCFFP